MVALLTGHTDDVVSVAFSPDGQTLASGSDDTTIRLWDVDTGENLETLQGHTRGGPKRGVFLRMVRRSQAGVGTAPSVYGTLTQGTS